MSETLPSVLPVLETTPQRWIRLAESIPPDMFHRAPAPKPETPSDPLEPATAFARLRDESLKLLAGLRPEDLARKARHQEPGIVSLEEMLNEWAGHDLMHTVQAERALMQPFISYPGPSSIGPRIDTMCGFGDLIG